MVPAMDQTSPYLDELEQLLLDQSDNFMLLSQLDGFLTGIVVSPDLLTPATWLKRTWAGNDGDGEPRFEDASDFQRFIDLVMRHYNAIIASLRYPGEYEPILEIDGRNDDVLWEIWIEGFGQAMDLAPAGWARLAAADDSGCTAAVTGIGALRRLHNDTMTFSRAEQDRWDADAPDAIPIWVETLHQWRVRNDPSRPAMVRRDKIGRNDPCPCGSGRKYKKCCGLN